ncbi:MAG TPA: hypothetical protein VMG60_18830 [Burkholderiaceae bacterium]|nr:hypothetical protein [Burkholderiaceae bacterium]
MADATSDQDQAPWWAWALPWSAAASGRAPWFGVAPQSLTQPINPGWSFGNVIVNNENSSAPDVEREVVTRHSYGRQIGRLMDAVETLCEAVPGVANDERIKEFRKLAAAVERIKKQAAPRRVEEIRRELEWLKRNDAEGFAKLREMLR